MSNNGHCANYSKLYKVIWHIPLNPYNGEHVVICTCMAPVQEISKGILVVYMFSEG